MVVYLQRLGQLLVLSSSLVCLGEELVSLDPELLRAAEQTLPFLLLFDWKVGYSLHLLFGFALVGPLGFWLNVGFASLLGLGLDRSLGLSLVDFFDTGSLFTYFRFIYSFWYQL